MGYDVPAARNFSSRSSASACIARATFISPSAVRSQIRFMNAGGAAVHMSACATATP